MKRILLATSLVAIVAAACGGGDDQSGMNMEGSTGTGGATAPATRSVDVTMVDIAFQPTSLKVQRGDRIEFVFHNRGKIAHDAFMGDMAAQADHEKEMREEDSMGGGHMSSEANAVTVEPGKTERLAYTFDEPGMIEIGCHQPGHYTAGMKIEVTVA